MRILLALALLAAACRKPRPPAPPAEQNRAEKFVGGLKADVKRAQEAKEKADAAIKKTDDSQKALQQAEGQ